MPDEIMNLSNCILGKWGTMVAVGRGRGNEGVARQEKTNKKRRYFVCVRSIATSLFGNFNLRNREISEGEKYIEKKTRAREKQIRASVLEGEFRHPGRAGDGIDMSR